MIVKDLKDEIKQIDERDGSDLAGSPSQLEQNLERLHERLKEKTALLAIAYYNLGCEYEHIH